MSKSAENHFRESDRENDVLRRYSSKKERKGSENFAANPNLYCTPEIQKIEYKHQTERTGDKGENPTQGTDNLSWLHAAQEYIRKSRNDLFLIAHKHNTSFEKYSQKIIDYVMNHKSEFWLYRGTDLRIRGLGGNGSSDEEGTEYRSPYTPTFGGKIAKGQKRILKQLEERKAKKVLEEPSQSSKEKESSNLAKSKLEVSSSSHNQYFQDNEIPEESYSSQEFSASEKELSEDEHKRNINLSFDEFKRIKVKSVYRAYNYIEKQTRKMNKNKKERENAANILRNIQHAERTQENYELYKEVENMQKNDPCIKTALKKIQLGKDISKIALSFSQFQRVKARSIGTACNRLDVSAKNSRIKRSERENAANTLRNIQYAERTQENYKLYKGVVKSAEKDKTILNALDKIEHESNDESN